MTPPWKRLAERERQETAIRVDYIHENLNAQEILTWLRKEKIIAK